MDEHVFPVQVGDGVVAGDGGAVTGRVGKRKQTVDVLPDSIGRALRGGRIEYRSGCGVDPIDTPVQIGGARAQFQLSQRRDLDAETRTPYGDTLKVENFIRNHVDRQCELHVLAAAIEESEVGAEPVAETARPQADLVSPRGLRAKRSRRERSERCVLEGA